MLQGILSAKLVIGSSLSLAQLNVPGGKGEGGDGRGRWEGERGTGGRGRDECWRQPCAVHKQKDNSIWFPVKIACSLLKSMVIVFSS